MQQKYDIWNNSKELKWQCCFVTVAKTPVRFYFTGTFCKLLHNSSNTTMRAIQYFRSGAVFVMILGATITTGQSTDDFINTLVERIDAYTFESPADNVYIHTDRGVYFPGQKIMFRAVVTDAATLLPSGQADACNIYLVNDEGGEEMSLSVDVISGFGYGSLQVPGNLKQGVYSLVAFVRSGQQITVSKPYVRKIILADPEKQILLDHSLEGGPFDASDEVVINVQAGDPGSWSLCKMDVSYIVVADQDTVETFAGKVERDGSFRLATRVPEELPGSMYVGITASNRKDEQEIRVRVPLFQPRPRPVMEKQQTGISIRVMGISNNRLKIATSFAEGRIDPDMKVVVAIFRKGLLYWSAPGTLSGSGEFSLPLARVPSGLLDIAILHPDGKLLAEKMIYYERDSKPGIDLLLDRESYSRRGKVRAEVVFSEDFDTFPEESVLTVSVVPEVLMTPRDMLIDEHMLLHTDLVGSSGALPERAEGREGDPFLAERLEHCERLGYDWGAILSGKQEREYLSMEEIFNSVSHTEFFPVEFDATHMKELAGGIRDRRTPNAQKTNYKNQLEAGVSVPEVIMGIKPYTRYGNKIIFAGKVNSFQAQQGALIVIDNQPIGQDASILESIQPQEVETIRVSTSSSDINKYTGNNSVGIIEVTLKGNETESKLSDEDRRDREIEEVAGDYLPGYPDYSEEKDVKSVQADYRSLLYWDPDLKPSVEEDTEFEFYTSDLPGNYVITVQGMIGPHPVAVRRTFEVR